MDADGSEADQPKLCSGLKEPGAVAIDVIAELDRGAGILLDQLPEERPPFHERLAPQILAVEVQEVEGKEHDAVRRLVDRRAQSLEIGSAVLVLDDDFTIEDGRLAGKLGSRLDHPAIGSGPVPTMTGEGPDLALVNDDQGAVAVMLDLVNPAVPRRNLLEATPLWPGQLYAATIRISNKNGQWQSFHELFVTLRRTVDVRFAKLKIINDGDPFDVGEADFTFQVIEGNLGVVKTITRPEANIDDNNPFDDISLVPASSFTFSIGPKSITEDNQKIAVAVAGHEHDGFLEPDEFAASSWKFLSIPTGMNKETVLNEETSVSAPTTSEADFTFSAVVRHSVTYG